MKWKMIFLFATWLFFLAMVVSADNGIPTAVLKVFQEKFAKVKPYHWDVNDTYVYAFYRENDLDKIVGFTINGKLSEMGYLTESYKVPHIVIDNFMKKFPSFDSREFYTVRYKTGKKGIIIIAEDPSNKYCILYSIEGELLRKDLFELPVEEFEVNK